MSRDERSRTRSASGWREGARFTDFLQVFRKMRAVSMCSWLENAERNPSVKMLLAACSAWAGPWVCPKETGTVCRATIGFENSWWACACACAWTWT